MLRRLSSLRAVGGASRRWCSSAADGGGGSAALTSLQTRMREVRARSRPRASSMRTRVRSHTQTHTHAAIHTQEFDRLYGTSTAKLPPLPPLPEPEAPPDGERPQKKQFVRRMPDHKLPG